jgi:hypothetical protein
MSEGGFVLIGIQLIANDFPVSLPAYDVSEYSGYRLINLH